MTLDSSSPSQITARLENSLDMIWLTFTEYVPSILGTIILLIVGYFISKIIARLSTKALATVGLDIAGDRIGLHQCLMKVGIKQKPSALFGILIFWLIMLTFIITATETLRLDNITDTIDIFIRYLPNIFGAGLIFVLGLMAAYFLRKFIENTTKNINFKYGQTLATVVYSLVLIVVSILSIEQLQLETQLLRRIIEIFLISVGAALAVSFGFGSKRVASNIVSGYYLREQFKPGVNISFNDVQGEVECVGIINTTIKSSAGSKIIIPNSTLAENTISSKS